MTRFTHEIAVINGGNSGTGLATDQVFVSEGAHVVITGRDGPKLRGEAKSLGGSATAMRTDVTNSADLDRL